MADSTSKQSKIWTFGKDENVYSDSSKVQEYKDGFIPGTLINCRSVNTALRVSTLVTDAMLYCLGFENNDELTGINNTKGTTSPLLDSHAYYDNDEFTVSFKDPTDDELDDIKNQSDLYSVIYTVFKGMRDFTPKNANTSDYVKCWKGSQDTESIDTTNADYHSVDDAFVHLYGNETVKGLKTFQVGVNIGQQQKDGAISYDMNANVIQSNIYGNIDSYPNIKDGYRFVDNGKVNSSDWESYIVTKPKPGVHSVYHDPADPTVITGGVAPAYNFGFNSNSGTTSVTMGFGNIITDAALNEQDCIAIGYDNIICGSDSVAIGNENHIGTDTKHQFGQYTYCFGKHLHPISHYQTLIGDNNKDEYSNRPAAINDTDTYSSFIITTSLDRDNGCNMIEGYSWKDSDNNLSQALYLNCASYCSSEFTSLSFNTLSDRRLKENIKDYDYHGSILDLDVKEFDMKSDGSHHIGCIAQDLQKLYPELVMTNADGYLSIEESKIAYLLLEEIKTLRKEVDELKKKVK